MQAVDPQALDRIDLGAVADRELGQVAGLQDLDALADDLMSAVAGGDVSHTDAVLAS